MKVYTEVNYIWKDNKLVQTNSKSFDYEGELTLCHSKTKRIGSKRFGRNVNVPHTHASVSTVVNKVKETVNKGPTGGTAKDWADKLYGGSTKDLVEKAQGTYKDLETSFNKNKDDLAQALFAPVKKTLEETATSIINEKNQTGGGGGGGDDDDLLYGSRRGMQMQDEGQRASSGGLRRNIHELRTLSGKAKPKG